MRSDYNVAGNKSGEGPRYPALTYLSWFPPLRSCAKSLCECLMGTGREIKIDTLGISTPSHDGSSRLCWAWAAGAPARPSRCPWADCLPQSASNVQLKKEINPCALPLFPPPTPGPSSFSLNLPRLECVRSPGHLHSTDVDLLVRVPRARAAATPAGPGGERGGQGPAKPGDFDTGSRQRRCRSAVYVQIEEITLPIIYLLASV